MNEDLDGIIKRLNKIIISFLLDNDEIIHFLEQAFINNRLFMLQGVHKINIQWRAVIQSVLYHYDGIDEMRSDVKDNPELNRLINIIFKIIIECPPIKKFVHSFDKNLLTLLDEAVIYIELEKFITNVIFTTRRPHIRITRAITKSAPQKIEAPRQSIDGKLLTKNEEAFAEFCAKRFDEKDWLEKHKIMLDPLEQEEKRTKRKKKIKPLLYSI